MNLNPFKKIFVDVTGEYAGFVWWWRWKWSFYHLRKWLRYEGMPKNIYDLEEVLKWNKKVAKRYEPKQNSPKIPGDI